MDSHTRRVKRHIFFLTAFLLLLFSACSPRTKVEKQYGSDADYFLALKFLDSNQTSKAIGLLEKSSSKGTPLISRRSLEQLVTISPPGKKQKYCKSLLSRYSDEEAITFVCRELSVQKNYDKIISLTESTDLSTCQNELAYYRIYSLLKKNDSRFSKELFAWCTKRPFTQSQANLVKELSFYPEEINQRLLTYERKYAESFPALTEYIEAHNQEVLPQLISDAGKSALYGNFDYAKSALFFDALSYSQNRESQFYALFYAGRLYDKAKAFDKAASRFKSAFETAPTSAQKDNALWYFLKGQMKKSTDAAVASLRVYGHLISDKYYYDDFFDELSQKLLYQKKFRLYYETALLCDKISSDESAAKFSYVAARLIQTGLVNPENASREEESTRLYNRSLQSGTDWYYRILAAGRLSLSQEETENSFHRFGVKKTGGTSEADRLLQGYADFGFTERIYPEWQKSRENTSLDCAKKISLYLKNSGSEENSYYTQSLRIAAWHAAHPDKDLDREFLCLVFPRDFSRHISSVCKEFGLEEFEMYSLVRSESFFDPKVTSSAQAKGLSQLMESTAADVAKRLHVKEYSLSDPETNLRFGAYYLAHLKGRLDGSPILSLFAYNAGITRVRQWLRESARDFNQTNPPKDLFLEALPFTETREYGRKTVSAAVIYAWLYENKIPDETVASLM